MRNKRCYIQKIGGEFMLDVNAIKRLDVIWVDFGNQKMRGSIQSGLRPAVVISNNTGNRWSGILEVATILENMDEYIRVIPLTSKEKRSMPTHLWIEGYGLKGKSLLLGEQITTISKMQVKNVVGRITDEETIDKINKIIQVSLGLK